MQFWREELPAGETELTGQSLQASDPVVPLYLSAAHATQGPPLGPVCPMLQVQFATLTLLLYGEYEFAGHDVHAVAAA